MKWQLPSHAGAYSIKLGVESLESRRLLAVAAFSLEDVNSTSATTGQMVSPVDFAGHTTAWYFAHST